MIKDYQPSVASHGPWTLPLLLAALLLIISKFNPLLFHTLAELFAIGVAVIMIVVAWNMHRFTKNHFLMFLGIGYFWVAIIDLFHTFAYKGMGIFSFSTPEQATQLWLAARYVETLALIAAPRFLTRPLQRARIFTATATLSILIAALFVSGVMPPMFIEGQGLTPFKVANEYAIIALLLVAAWRIWRVRPLLESSIARLTLISITLTICAELAFTTYINVFGLGNILGHIFKFFSFWAIFLATIQTTLQRPFLAMAKSADSYDAIPYATLVVDNEGIIRQVNQAACRMAQCSREELVGTHCHEIYHPSGTVAASCPICLCVEHNEATSNIELHDRISNTFFDYSLAVITDGLSSQGVVQTIRDITASKRAEQRLQESERYNRMLFESSPVGLALRNMNGELLDVNPAFAKIIGRSVDETLQLNCMEITCEQQREHGQMILEQLFQHGSYGPYETGYRHADGHMVPVRLNSLILERDGENCIWSSVEDITLQKENQQRLDFMAYHDSLTNLPNRILLNDRTQHALQVANRAGEQVAVLFIDLDRFKNINDSLGHYMGDKLLQQTANRLRFLIREQDTLARLGGDEFVILLEKIRDRSDVTFIADKLLAAFETPFVIEGHTLYITLSIGISLYPDDGRDVDTLLRHADAAMYHSKESGRNSCHLYTAALSAGVNERLLLENGLRQALGNNELLLHYQPQYELDSGRLLGAEALLRWNHPTLGQLLPERFITVAEDCGLIIPIGEWVIASACAQMRDWLRAGIEIDTIAVNVSGLQFQRGDIAATVKRALRQSGIEPHRLELEITESTLMSRPEAAISALNELKALGVMISIDDFGTGYSSLSQLKLLPLDKLKIDRSFVRDIPLDKDDEAIACAVIALGQSLEMRVNAEGIETAAQRDFLMAHGCSEGQGYLYSKAVNSDEFMALARQRG